MNLHPQTLRFFLWLLVRLSGRFAPALTLLPLQRQEDVPPRSWQEQRRAGECRWSVSWGGTPRLETRVAVAGPSRPHSLCSPSAPRQRAASNAARSARAAHATWLRPGLPPNRSARGGECAPAVPKRFVFRRRCSRRQPPKNPTTTLPSCHPRPRFHPPPSIPCWAGRPPPTRRLLPTLMRSRPTRTRSRSRPSWCRGPAAARTRWRCMVSV